MDKYDSDLVLNVVDTEDKLPGFGGSVVRDDANSTFTVKFDVNTLKEHAGETISFKVTMSIKEGADLATDINNEVTFDNNFGDQSAQDSVKTYGKSFEKIDADTKKGLAGAVFYVKKGDLYLGERDGKLAWEASTGTDDEGNYTFADGFTVKELTSGDDGSFSVSGLARTDENGAIVYELEEIKAPEGYVLSENTFKFIADNGKVSLSIRNIHKGSLPSTGGKGIVAFVAVGVIAIAGAGLYFMKGRKQIEG